MKTAKSPKSEEITPSKKVLKQARLPFKLISDVSPKSNTTRPRKRKLSSTDTETASKIGKIKDQNKDTDVCVVISDEDSKDGSKTQSKTLNPFVKIVDVARKKKLQKKSKKKKLVQSKSSVELNSSEANGTANNSEVVSIDTDNDSVSAMEVDVDQDVEKGEVKMESSKDQEVTEAVGCNGNEADLTKDESDAEKDASDHEDAKKDASDHEDAIKDASDHEDAKKDASDHEDNQEDSSVKPSPKRRTRSRKNNLNSSQTSKANESVSSNPSTPKRTNRSSSVTNSNGDTSLNESSNTNLTPKQQQKRLESAKKKEEREKERLEREKKRQQEKEERAKQKQEKEEQRKREKEEKEEAKRKEKEEKEKQKELEKKLREEKEELKRKEKEEKEEQKRKEREEKEEQKRKEKEAREEEKRKKQEALELEKLEQEQKKKKAAEAFVSFFVPKQKIEKDQPTVSKNDRLSSFTIKSDMRLAPTIRSELSDDRKKELENLLSKQCVDKNKLYVHELREGTKKPQTSGKTWPLSDKDDDDDVMIIEDELPPVDTAGEIQTCEPAVREKLRPKLLSFHENRRPPYWGTWRKKSQSIKPTQPFKMDQKLLDYDVDSDEEWEEEQEGESIDGSAAGSDDEPEDDYEVDNEVFVPHGYLSDEEATMDDDDVMSLSPETQKAKLKHLEDEFETQLKKPTEKLKPRMYGLLWVTEDGGKPDNCADVLWNYFGKLAMIMDDTTPLLQPSAEQEDTERKKVKKKKLVAEGEQQDSPKSEKRKKTKVNDKEAKKPKEVKKAQEPKKNQPVINSFLTKLNNTT